MFCEQNDTNCKKNSSNCSHNIFNESKITYYIAVNNFILWFRYHLNECNFLAKRKILVSSVFENLNFPFKNFKFPTASILLITLGSSGESYRFQPSLSRFLSSILNTTSNKTDIGIIEYNGITFNWMTRMLVICGGQQVSHQQIFICF
jgi:hypothetical protein